MKVAVYSTKPYDRSFLDQANEASGHELIYYEPRLTRETCALAKGCDAVCCFVNDHLDAGVLLTLQHAGVKMIALRCAGFNNVDLEVARELAMPVLRVPAYSPYAVAEHALALMLALNRRVNRAWSRVREMNFALEGLLGFEMRGKTVGIVGTGKIGCAMAELLSGFGMNLIGYDRSENDHVQQFGLKYVPLEQLFSDSDIVTLHCPLTTETHHMINADTLGRMKKGAMLINTSRGGLIDTRAAIDGLKNGKLGYLGLDVYEEEDKLFFEDLSDEVIADDVFARLLTFPNVLITSHQAFFTHGALLAIAQTTIENLDTFSQQQPTSNCVTCQKLGETCACHLQPAQAAASESASEEQSQ